MTTFFLLLLIFACWSYVTERCNCLVWALIMKARWGRHVKIQCVLNRAGRYHWRVMFAHGAYEWYAKGASTRHWARNLWYKGKCRMVRP